MHDDGEKRKSVNIPIREKRYLSSTLSSTDVGGSVPNLKVTSIYTHPKINQNMHAKAYMKKKSKIKISAAVIQNELYIYVYKLRSASNRTDSSSSSPFS